MRVVVALALACVAAPARADVVEPTVELPPAPEPVRPAPTEARPELRPELPSGPPGMQESQFEACMAHRRAIYRDAMLARQLEERGRLLRSMPECRLPPQRPASAVEPDSSATMPLDSAPGMTWAMAGRAPSLSPYTPGDAPADAASARSGRRDPASYSILAEPFSLIFATIGLQVESAIAQEPSIGLAAHVGLGNTTSVTIGERVHNYSRGDTFDDLHEVSFTRLHFGTQLNLYVQGGFQGPHVGIEGLYKYYASSDAQRGDIGVLSGSIYGGWKWMTSGRFTATLQVGAGIVGKKDDDEMAGWEHDREGTLGGAHLFGNLALGWSI